MVLEFIVVRGWGHLILSVGIALDGDLIWCRSPPHLLPLSGLACSGRVSWPQSTVLGWGAGGCGWSIGGVVQCIAVRHKSGGGERA